MCYGHETAIVRIKRHGFPCKWLIVPFVHTRTFICVNSYLVTKKAARVCRTNRLSLFVVISIKNHYNVIFGKSILTGPVWMSYYIFTIFVTSILIASSNRNPEPKASVFISHITIYEHIESTHTNTPTGWHHADGCNERLNFNALQTVARCSSKAFCYCQGSHFSIT